MKYERDSSFMSKNVYFVDEKKSHFKTIEKVARKITILFHARTNSRKKCDYNSERQISLKVLFILTTQKNNT